VIAAWWRRAAPIDRTLAAAFVAFGSMTIAAQIGLAVGRWIS
jgi:hypothetical protein